MSEQIYTHRELTADQTFDCDVCVIGSGAGGAVLAAGLVERGLKVVMLEEGSYRTREDWIQLDEKVSYPMLYQDRAGRSTADQSITILQGRTVGGSTVVNWTTCYRTPDRILRRWQELGVDTLSTEVLTPHWEAVEQRLNISEWSEAAMNPNNRLLKQGCDKLGWEAHVLRRNVKGCANSGYCGLGCPVNAKQAMHITYIRDALEKGLTLLANCRADRIETEGDKATAVHCSVMDPDRDVATPVRITIRPKVVVSSTGAVNGPALFLRSGLDDNGQVGKRTWLHPVVVVPGMYDQEVNGWYGAPQSAASHQFIDRGPDEYGFFFEVAPMQPMLASTAVVAYGGPQREFMEKLAHTSGMISLHLDGWIAGDEGGTVSLQSDGRIKVDYPISEKLAAGFRASHEALARVHLAAGAHTVLTTHTEPLMIRSEADIAKLATLPYGAHQHSIFTAHQMGGLTMGPDPKVHTVDNRLRHHRVHNLFVVDGSVFPTALGVNPSETIYGIAHWAREIVAEAV